MNTVNETSSLSPFLIQSAIAMNRTCVGANGKRTKQFRQQTEQKRTKQCEGARFFVWYFGTLPKGLR